MGTEGHVRQTQMQARRPHGARCKSLPASAKSRAINADCRQYQIAQTMASGGGQRSVDSSNGEE
jgi:hypothetical protein